MSSDSSLRIGPLAPEEMDDKQRAMYAAGPELNIFATLLRHPGLYRRWAPFGGKLLRGAKLPARDRELIVLRTAFRCGSAYEWGQHVGIGREAGLNDEEMRRIAKGPDAAGWSTQDAAKIRAVDELTDHHRISDETWATLAGIYSEMQLIEVPMLSGHYAMLAGALNSFGVPTEGPLPALGEV
ncbi:MAG: carboxymuconolactone decarboxylase family protein [Aquihabitans sp.]